MEQHSDHQLLEQYHRNQDERAFAVLVERHLNLVYGTALRRVRSSHLAEEVCQSVFQELAKVAANLSTKTVICAWLHKVARNKSVDLVRSEMSRKKRESIATEIQNTAEDVKSIEVGGGFAITQKAPIDEIFDKRYVVGANGGGEMDFLSIKIVNNLKPVYEAYAIANGGEYADEPEAYLPYTTNEKQNAIIKKLAYTTVATMLRRMEEKGLVTHTEENRTYLYHAAIQEENVSKSLASELLNKLFDGNLTGMMSHLLCVLSARVQDGLGVAV